MVALRREERKSERRWVLHAESVGRVIGRESGRALRVLRCLRSVGRESLKPRLCDERIKSPILESPIGLGSVPFRSGNVPRPGFHLIVFPLLFPLWEEFSPLVPAFLGTFPGVFPLLFSISSGNFPLSRLFPQG